MKKTVWLKLGGMKVKETDDWMLLLGVPHDIEADIITGLLEAEGIPVRKTYSGIGQFMHMAAGKAGWTELWVPRSRWEEARIILESEWEGLN